VVVVVGAWGGATVAERVGGNTYRDLVGVDGGVRSGRDAVDAAELPGCKKVDGVGVPPALQPLPQHTAPTAAVLGRNDSRGRRHSLRRKFEPTTG